MRPLSPTWTLTAAGKEIAFSRAVCGESCALKRKGGRCCVSAWEDEYQNGRRETGILVPPLCLLFVERGSLGSFGAFSAGVSSIPRHLPSVAQEVGDAGMPQAAGGEFCDGGTSLFMLLDLWEWGKWFVLKRK